MKNPCTSPIVGRLLILVYSLVACAAQPLTAIASEAPIQEQGLILVAVQAKAPTSGATFLNDLDREQPVIQHTAGTQGIAGDPQTFSARVTDNRSVAEVVLFARASELQPFSAIRMNAEQGSNDYRATITTDAGQLRVEYYFTATDVAGQKTLSGFPYSPYIRTLLTNENTAGLQQKESALKSPTSKSSSGGGKKWLYVVLGVLAVGAIAAASGGDSGASTSNGGGLESDPGNNTPSTTGPGVPVTINVPLPQ